MTAQILLNSAAVLAGLLLLYYGGHYLVKGASGVALKFNIPPVVIGLTIVAFGTSAPELFVSLFSALQGYVDISLGNVVGSNIINIALILGISGLLLPVTVSAPLIKRDTPVMFASYGVLMLAVFPFSALGDDPASGVGTITRWKGAVMVLLLIAYVYGLYRHSRNHADDVADLVEMDEIDERDARRPMWLLLLEIAGGVAGLAFGSEFLINGASWLARNIFGASDRFIGITIVAFGTSLPELVTSVIAAAKKEMDISVGNIVGSNIFNSLMVLGATAIITPISLSTFAFIPDLAVMLAVSALLYLVMLVSRKIGRGSSLLFLSSYAAYLAFLLMNRGM